MIKLITGGKGTGKTKTMIDMANDFIERGKENVVFLDNSPRSIYALKHKVRLITLYAYPIKNSKGFIGFLYGIISANYDIEVIFIDNLLELTGIEVKDLSTVLEEIKVISEKFEIKFIISVGCNETEFPEELKENYIA